MENEALRKQLFEKDQQLKLANDRISQLHDTNIYRREVVRLEAVLEKHAEEKLKLTEDLKRRNEEYKTVSSSVSDLLTQNTILKNQLKQQKQLLINEGTQTCEQVSDVCEKCNEDHVVINELIQVLDSIQAMVEQKDNDDLEQQQK